MFRGPFFSGHGVERDYKFVVIDAVFLKLSAFCSNQQVKLALHIIFLYISMIVLIDDFIAIFQRGSPTINHVAFC